MEERLPGLLGKVIIVAVHEDRKGETMTHPTSSKELLINLSKTFNADAARGVEADIQFEFSGSETGIYNLRIANGKCTFLMGELSFPRLTIRVDANVWRDIQNGKISWNDAMMQRIFLGTGNFLLLARLPQLFKIG